MDEDRPGVDRGERGGDGRRTPRSILSRRWVDTASPDERVSDESSGGEEVEARSDRDGNRRGRRGVGRWTVG